MKDAGKLSLPTQLWLQSVAKNFMVRSRGCYSSFGTRLPTQHTRVLFRWVTFCKLLHIACRLWNRPRNNLRGSKTQNFLGVASLLQDPLDTSLLHAEVFTSLEHWSDCTLLSGGHSAAVPSRHFETWPMYCVLSTTLYRHSVPRRNGKKGQWSTISTRRLR